MEQANNVACGPSDALVYAFVHALVWFADDDVDLVFVFIDDIHSVVLARAVYNDIFYIAIVLAEETLDTVAYSLLAVETTCDDGYFHRFFM